MSNVVTILVLFFVAAIWAGAFPAIRIALEYTSPTGLLISRMVPTAVISILIAFIFFYRKTIKLFPKYWVMLVTVSVIWLFGYHYALNIGETVIPAGPAGLIIGTYPIFTLFLASIFVNEKLTVNKVVGAAIAFAGTAFLMIFGAMHEGAELNIEPAKWIMFGLITFLAPISAAVHTIIMKPYLTGENRDGVKFDPVHLTVLYMAPAGILLIPIWMMNPLPSLSDLTAEFHISLWFLIIFCTLVAYIGWLWAVGKIGAGPASMTTYIIPVISIIYAKLLLDEPIGPGSIIGAVGIISGVIVASIGGGKGNNKKAKRVRAKIKYG